MDAPRDRLWSATELAEEFHMTPRALRFYETKGLMSPRRVGSRRVYGHRDRGRLQLIVRGKRLGFSLATIKEYMDLYDVDTDQVKQLRRLEELVGRRIEQLEEQRVALEATLVELEEVRCQVKSSLAAKK
jgi:DNA-binding transcriptional MerR regulator